MLRRIAIAIALSGLACAQTAPADQADLFAQASALHQQHQDDAAISLLTDYVAGHPSETAARLELARYYGYTRRFPEAMLQYRSVLQDDPANLRAQVGVAKVLSWQGDLDASLREFNRILERSPYFYDARVGKGFTLLWMGDKHAAYGLLHAASAAHPEDAEVAETVTQLQAELKIKPAALKPEHIAEDSAPSARKRNLPPMGEQAPPIIPDTAPIPMTGAQPAPAVTQSTPEAVPPARLTWWMLFIPLVFALPTLIWAAFIVHGRWKTAPAVESVVAAPPPMAPEDSIHAPVVWLDSAPQREDADDAYYSAAGALLSKSAPRPQDGFYSAASGNPQNVVEAPEPIAFSAGAPAPQGERPRILLVEAKATLAACLKKEGMDVTTARSVAFAVINLESGDPDVVVLDVDMPAGAADEILRWLAIHRPSLGPRTILMSEQTSSDVRHIAKPVSPEDLLSRIGALLASPSGSSFSPAAGATA
jgi:tetratricopeptide (TPR) repeat protein